jgi:hypothetical protein
MSKYFYLRRFLLAFLVASTRHLVAQFLKGHAWELSVPDGLLWGAISAGVYVGVSAYKLRNACPAGLPDPGAEP